MAIKNPLTKAIFAEFIATALFVWIGCGSAIATNKWGAVSSGADLLTIAIAFGFAITLLAYSIGGVSGGHINPAVSFAVFIVGGIDFKTMACYILAQFGGAVTGALLLWGCAISLTLACDDYEDPSSVPVCAASALPDGRDGYGPPFGLGVNSLSPRVGLGSGFMIEVMGTYLLVFTVCMSAIHKKSAAGNAAPIAIGWSVMMAHIVLVPFTGCGINPARSFGPMFINSIGGVNPWTKGWWIYYVAPFVGAAIAAMTYKIIFAEEEEEQVKEGGSLATEAEHERKPSVDDIEVGKESLAANIYKNAFAEDEEEDL
ncbi:unnamed protein product [Cylindrotheca closterium]|uniref:Aquaporin n=1 Tax=Cylindrotheca closterium TaxID=2856 RepID=A0AAD2CG82_9STRA|nr:unnamed protein product [Cylindrotheca closterium]